MKNSVLWLLLVWLFSEPSWAGGEPVLGKEALVVGDYVRVREAPSLTSGSQVGWLFKNMKVRVIEKSPESVVVDGQTYRWYRIKGEGIEGWCVGKFLDPEIPAGVDTYDAPGDMEWFYNKHGYGTWFQENAFSYLDFSLDDYRNLIKAAEKQNEAAMIALGMTIYQHLKKKPDDPDYRYLKPKLYSWKVLSGFVYRYQVFDDLLPREEAGKAALQAINSGFDFRNLPQWLRDQPQLLIEYSKILYQLPTNQWAHFPTGWWSKESFVLELAKSWEAKPGNCGFRKNLPKTLTDQPGFLEKLKKANLHCAVPEDAPGRTKRP